MKAKSKYIRVFNMLALTCLLLLSSSQPGLARQLYSDSQMSVSGNDPLIIWNELSSDKHWQVLVRQLNAQKYVKMPDPVHSFCFTGEYISEKGESGDLEFFVFDFSKSKGRKMEIASLVYSRVDDCIYRGYIIFPDDILAAMSGGEKRVEKSVNKQLKMVEPSGWFAEFQKQLSVDSETCIRSIRVCMKRAKPEKTEFGLAEILRHYWACDHPTIAEICHQSTIINGAARAASINCKD